LFRLPRPHTLRGQGRTLDGVVRQINVHRHATPKRSEAHTNSFSLGSMFSSDANLFRVTLSSHAKFTLNTLELRALSEPKIWDEKNKGA
jgi:hypothetical protein